MVCSSASLLMTQNWEEWLMHERVVLPSRETSTGWRCGLTRISRSSTRGSAKFCTLVGTTPLIYICWGLCLIGAIVYRRFDDICMFRRKQRWTVAFFFMISVLKIRKTQSFSRSWAQEFFHLLLGLESLNGLQNIWTNFIGGQEETEITDYRTDIRKGTNFTFQGKETVQQNLS